MSELFDAIDRGDAGTVWRLTRSSIALHEIDEATGMTPLALAADLGASEIVRTLLESKADPDRGGSTTPLEAAVVQGSGEIVDLLIEAGADVNLSVEDSYTPLMTAAAMGDIMLVKRLLLAGARPRKKNSEDQTAMMIARDEGHDAVAEVLRQAAGWRRKGASRTGPVRSVHVDEVMAEAEAAGVDPSDGMSSDGVSSDGGDGIDPRPPVAGAPPASPDPLPMAADISWSEDDTTPVPILREEEPTIGATASHATVEELTGYLADDDEESIGELFRSGEVDVEAHDEEGATLLMVAAHRGERQAALLLIEYGADIEACDDAQWRRSVLVHAVHSVDAGRDAVVELLVSRQVDIDRLSGQRERTALMHAAELDVYAPERDAPNGFGATTRNLLRLGADPEIPDSDGRTVWQVVDAERRRLPGGSPMGKRLQKMLDLLEESGAIAKG